MGRTGRPAWRSLPGNCQTSRQTIRATPYPPLWTEGPRPRPGSPSVARPPAGEIACGVINTPTVSRKPGQAPFGRLLRRLLFRVGVVEERGLVMEHRIATATATAAATASVLVGSTLVGSPAYASVGSALVSPHDAEVRLKGKRKNVPPRVGSIRPVGPRSFVPHSPAAISGDGRKLVYAIWNAKSPTNRVLYSWTQRSTPKLIARNFEGDWYRGAVVSSDGRFVTSQYLIGGRRNKLLRYDSSNGTYLDISGTDGYSGAFDQSGDGRFTAYVNDWSDLTLVDADTGVRTVIADHKAMCDDRVAVSGSGPEVTVAYWMCEPEEGRRLYIWDNASGSRPTALTTINDITQMSITNDGRYVDYAQSSSRIEGRDVFRADVTTGQVTKLIPPIPRRLLIRFNGAELSADGKWMFFTIDRFSNDSPKPNSRFRTLRWQIGTKRIETVAVERASGDDLILTDVWQVSDDGDAAVLLQGGWDRSPGRVKQQFAYWHR